MNNHFPHLKSQEEIDREIAGPILWWKVYFASSLILTITFYLLAIIAMLKWIFS
ncbi:hypothetical protein [Silicibacter phage DSS3phi2]|uniref:Uncharacterized protein n=5 Tax=Aorunvirus V12 TaxID=2846074 RepID=A0A2Z4QGB5_9CAUD|nr:hypothetical protein DSS3P2_gp13 [Silicibacter phage DSS3phi2]YP_009880419.1 hypothetical protein HYP62_gp16 [Ruegeria phage vB_RpoP-V12]AWY08974.1 hypothetical protein vBRpoPV21_16 [Ruegeria phage vB_RpoP-V21]AWY09535.1 hypothetical protein vBRpoPV17_16 [Ruegeria phage vB_RpoP-V17]AXF42136.1 hypothetical protein vBRpoPV14_18 [Ruegeria phage vB_RpoP-V14]ACL81281.1 hypothetical protein [Silicibacter phage DSS3phi2]AWY08803.1 hypothetical protein vBRpoPV12_16 [Ruegeria phage vB_RpoP-V12]